MCVVPVLNDILQLVPSEWPGYPLPIRVDIPCGDNMHYSCRRWNLVYIYKEM